MVWQLKYIKLLVIPFLDTISKVIRKILIALVLFFLVFILTPPVFAAEEFATSYDVVYDVDTTGVTTVTEKVTLRNLTSQYYASQFKLTIGATEVFDIKASDPGGALEVSSKQEDTSTSINVKFNSQVAGLDKTLPWTLQFKSKDFAERVGKVWEVRAPKISATSNLESYNLTISVPLNFGEPTLISPQPKSQTVSQNRMFFTFDKSSLEGSGVSASFGTIQLFDFDLAYHLENNNFVPILTNIALPPDTAYQDVIFQRMEPKPVNVTVDDDGNYLAWYRLSRGQKIDVSVIGSAKLYTKSKIREPYLNPNLKNKYTQSNKYWETNHPQISQKLAEILGDSPPEGTRERIRLVYKYVVDSLKYDSSRLTDNIDRLGALTVLNNPDSAVCMEFTDLFITLARAAHIPARELNGFAYSANPKLRPLSLSKDVLHAWPEYWDDKLGWVMVDPTWENTTGGVDYFNKLDLNHFTFVTKGMSSTQPVPAGSYKYIGQDSRDVKVTLTDTDFLGKAQINAQVETANPIIAGFPSKITVKVFNEGNAVFPAVNFDVGADRLSVTFGKGKNLGVIPPFGSAAFEYNLRTKSIFDEYEDTITVDIGGQKFTREVNIAPFILFQKVPLFGIGILGGMVIIYLTILGGLFYKRRKK